MAGLKGWVGYVVVVVVSLQIIFVLSSQDCREPIVSTTRGQLRGALDKLVDGSSYYRFRGIPYAAPPIGDLRFKEPRPPLPWGGVRDAQEFGNICAQFNVTHVGHEDCLFLNVYTKSLRRDAATPVMVFIHGGSFSQGSGDFFLPDFLLRHDVVLVTFNYRLEVLGYLSLGTAEAPGNAGMKDQVAALRWVRDNVARFGGDPGRVTLFGESSGAAAAVYHMFSPMSVGLFHGVIAQSGSYDLVRARGAEARAFRVGEVLGERTSDPRKLVDFLRSVDASALTNMTLATLTADERFRGLPVKFVPIAEKKIPGVEAFMTGDPTEMLVEGRVARVPLMIGYNSGEGLIMVKYHVGLLDVYNEKPSFYVSEEIVDRVSPTKVVEFGARIKKFYVGDRNMSGEDLGAIRDLRTDMHFSYTTQRFAELYAALEPRTFLYRFDAVTELNAIKRSVGLPALGGASHADELFYLFYNYFNDEPYRTRRRLRDLVYRVTKLWTDFAKTRRPTPAADAAVRWRPYTAARKEFFVIDEAFAAATRADGERMRFWNSLYEEAGLPRLAH